MRSVCSAPMMVVALMIGAVACSSSDADTTSTADGTAPAGTNFAPSADVDGTEAGALNTTPLTEAELMTPTPTWSAARGGYRGWDEDGTDPYSIHICGDTHTLKVFPELFGLEHVDQVFDGAPGSLAEAVFAGTSDQLATAYETSTQKLSDCLADPQVTELTDLGFDVTATPLPPLGLGQADFSLRQRVGDLCDHRLALVLTRTRLVVVELTTSFNHRDRFTDGDFRAIVENAVRQTTP